MPHRNTSREFTSILSFLMLCSLLTLPLNHSAAASLKPEPEAIRAQQLASTKQKKRVQSIRVAVLPFYSSSPAMQNLVDKSRLLVTAQLEDSQGIDLVSQDLIPSINKNYLPLWFPDIPGLLSDREWNRFGWKTSAQVIIRGQVFPPITLKKKILTKPTLVLSAKSVETGKVVIISATPLDWTNQVKELGEKMAQEILKPQRSMIVSNLLKSGLIHTTTVSLGKIPRPIIKLTFDAARSDKTVSTKDKQFLLENLRTGFNTLGFKTHQKDKNKKKAVAFARVSISNKILIDDNGKKYKRALIRIVLTKSNERLYRNSMTQLIFHRTTLKQGLKVLAARVAKELLIPKPVFKALPGPPVSLPKSASHHKTNNATK